MKLLRAVAAAAILMFGTLVPAAALQGQGPHSATFETTLTPDSHGSGAYEGKLTLTISADGIVNGYFRPEGSGRLSDVTGGLDGNRIWLDLGRAGLGHIDGTYDGRTIFGGTYLDGQTYTFRAAPGA